MHPNSILFDAETVPELEKDEAWWKVYEESIPASEREPLSIILKGLEEKVARALRARLDGKTVGMASVHFCHHPVAVFLSLLAVDPAHREHHIGGELLEYAFRSSCEFLEAQGVSPMGMIWEVDDLERADTAAERTTRERRINFYADHGGVLLNHPYMLPPLMPGNAIVPMRLMFRPAREGFLPDPKEIRDLIWAMYFEKYCRVNGINQSLLEDLFKQVTKDAPPETRHVL